MSKNEADFFYNLEEIVRDRMTKSRSESYTAKLIASGSKRIAQKVGEEGVELALAAVTQNKEEVIDEAADLMYHLIVLLADQGLALEDVSRRLHQRHSAAINSVNSH